MKLKFKQQLTLAEKQRQDTIDYISNQLQYSKYLSQESLNNPCLYEKQIGRSYLSHEFENLLKKLNPNFIFEVNARNPSKKFLYLATGFDKIKVCPYENNFITENSIWAAKSEEVMDPDFAKLKTVGGYTFPYINKKDIPKSEFVPGKGLVFDSEVYPGFKNVDIPWMEARRGWREVLCIIVGMGLATPTQVETIFGTSNRAPWARKMGKKMVANLW